MGKYINEFECRELAEEKKKLNWNILRVRKQFVRTEGKDSSSLPLGDAEWRVQGFVASSNTTVIYIHIIQYTFTYIHLPTTPPLHILKQQ